LSIQDKNFIKNITNICSYFIDKYDSKCYNKNPSCTLGGALYDLLQPLICTELLYLSGKANECNSSLMHPLNLRFLPLNSKEDMNRQEKQRKLNNLLEILKATPHSDECIDFVLQLAEESITMETLQNLIKNNNAATQGDVKEQRLDDISEFKFTNKEINQMPKTFRKEFRADGCTARIRKKPSGKNGYLYEIRYRRNGYNISASNKNLEEAKRLFIEQLKTAKVSKKITGVPKTFHSFTMYYFENFRIKKVTEKTYKTDYNRYKRYLQPYFEEIPLVKITPKDCQDLLDDLEEEGKGKTAGELYSLLSVIFKTAMLHRLIDYNPLDIVIHTKHESQHGVALTKEEEKKLLANTNDVVLRNALALGLYTGMRPNEYKTAKIEGQFIVAVNSKRKNGKIEYKKIPITKMLEPYLKDGINVPTEKRLRAAIRAVLPDHKLYDLRTTFYTRCMECGVAEPAMKAFVGHSFGQLGDAYTDLSDEYLLQEGAKLLY
jgi:integrase